MSDPLPPIERLMSQRAWLERFVVTLVVDTAEAEDLAQETLLAALARPPDELRRPRAWLGAVAQNLLRRFRVGERARRRREHFSAPHEALPATDAVVARAALHRAVVDSVLAVDEPYRTTLLLRFFDELPPRAIAQRSEVPVETVRTRVKRGLELVRARLVAARSSPAGGWAVALVDLLGSRARREVGRALLAKAAHVAPMAGAGILAGAVVMSTQAKLVVAATVIAVASFAIVTFHDFSGPQVPTPLADARNGEGTALEDAATEATLPDPVTAARTVDAASASDGATPAAPPAPGDPERDGVAVEGVVYTPRGEPARGAIVVIAPVQTDRNRLTSTIDLARAARWFEEPIDDDVKCIRVRTDNQGTFRATGIAPGSTIDVGAVHREEGLAVLPGQFLDPSKRPLRVELTLDRGVVLLASVRDVRGLMLEGARLAVSGERDRSRWSVTDLKTDAQGRCQSLPLPFTSLSVACTKPGFIRQELRSDSIADGSPARLDFVLDAVVNMEGRVVASEGGSAGLAQLGGEFVMIASIEDPALVARVRKEGVQGTVHRDDDRYEFQWNDDALRFVSLWQDDVLLGVAPLAGRGAAPDLPIDRRRIAAHPAVGALTVEVVDAASLSPVSHFTVDVSRVSAWLLGVDPQASHREVTSTDGTILLDSLAPGRYELAVRADGFAGRAMRVTVEARPAESRIRVDLARAAGALRGRVVDSLQRGVGAASLLLCTTDGHAAQPRPGGRASTDATGQFTIGEVAGGRHVLIASKDGFAPIAVPVQAGDEDVVISLQPGIEVTFQLRGGERPYEGDYGFRVLDERSIPVVDAEEGICGGSARSVRLLPGWYTAEFIAPHRRSEAVRFEAVEGAGVPIVFVDEK